MGQTSVNPEVLEPIVTAIGSAITDLQTAANEINKNFTSEEFYESWQGSSADACHEAYSEYQDTLVNKVPELVTTMQQYVDKCKQELISLDAELAGK